jgi:hypothetical protein
VTTVVTLAGRRHAARHASAADPSRDGLEDGSTAPLPGGTIATGAAVWLRSARPLPTLDAASARHLDDLWMQDSIVSIEVVPRPAVVYDVTIGGDHLFFADGMLVHNCDPCSAVDGEVYDYGDEDQIQNEPPYYLCEGGDKCRCVQIYQLKTGGQWTVKSGGEDEDAAP